MSSKSVIGLDQIIERFDRSTLIGMVNWVMMGGVEGIWEGLCEEVFPKLREPSKKHVFIDLCDPAKRTDGDIMRAIRILQRMNNLVPVTLGLNQAEAERIARVVGADEPAGQEMETLGMAMRSFAVEIQKKTGFAMVVVHPREGAAAADATGSSAWFEGPFTRTPRLSTGAGDHFSAGFALGQAIGMPMEQSLALGCATSGAYVRDAESPTLDRLVEFLSNLPAGESHS
jgi:sugar/nucleoside kinase (ribokinase family)